jgi:hypothetical protein
MVSPDRRGLRRVLAFAQALLGYFLGFIALASFAAVAYAGGPPDPAAWRRAFLIGGGLALVELLVLFKLPKPANRLIVAANLYLMLGGLAFALKQWWVLGIYETWALSGILLCMLAVGVLSTVFTTTGFIGAQGRSVRVRQASCLLLALVALGALWAKLFPSTPRDTGVTALALSQRALRAWVQRSAQAPDADR